MNRKSFVMGLALAMSVAAGLRAEDTPPAADHPAATETAVPAKDKFVTDLSARYNVPEREIAALRAKGMGWGEIGHALSISQKSGKPLSEVMALRDSGMGWGQISQKYGFKLGDVQKQARGIEKQGRQADGTAGTGRSPHTDGPGHGHGSMGGGAPGNGHGHGEGAGHGHGKNK